MTALPTITTIQASDAPEHTDKLQKILQNLKTENRIDGFTTLGMEDDLSSLTDIMEEGNFILIVLTRGMESQREQVKDQLKAFKMANPEAGIAEIIVDNVPYENIFYTLPEDFRPICDREDRDVVWNNIEESLKDMFPRIDPPPPWPKYLKIAGILGGVILVFFIIRGLLDGDNNNNNGGPRVVVCLDSFSYSRTSPRGSGADLRYLSHIKTSFRLVNTSDTQVTVSRVNFNPVGTTVDGRHRGQFISDAELNEAVPGYGVAPINDLSFTNNVVIHDRSWIDNPEAVNVVAFWPSKTSRRYTLRCIPRVDGTWLCGKETEGRIVPDPACH